MKHIYAIRISKMRPVIKNVTVDHNVSTAFNYCSILLDIVAEHIASHQYVIDDCPL